MKLLWEDIQKYGTKEEIEFLTEKKYNIGDFTADWVDTKIKKSSLKHKKITFKDVILFANIYHKGELYSSKIGFYWDNIQDRWVHEENYNKRSISYEEFLDLTANWLKLDNNAFDIIKQGGDESLISRAGLAAQKKQKDYGNPIANKWMELDPFMTNEFDNLFGTRTEDIYKYGTKEEIQFLLEAIMPGSFVKSIMNFKNYLNAPQGQDAKVQYQNLLNQVKKIQEMGSTGITNYVRDNQKSANDFINFVDLLLKGKRPPEPVLINLP